MISWVWHKTVSDGDDTILVIWEPKFGQFTCGFVGYSSHFFERGLFLLAGVFLFFDWFFFNASRPSRCLSRTSKYEDTSYYEEWLPKYFCVHSHFITYLKHRFLTYNRTMLGVALGILMEKYWHAIFIHVCSSTSRK